MNKIRYEIIMDSIITSIPDDFKPKLLLHCCCAPCSTSVIELLKKKFDITLLFYNPNIYPLKEYNLRLDELYRFVSKYDNSIDIIEGLYDEKAYAFALKEYENFSEGSMRCDVCIGFRLEETAKKAKDKNFDYFATTLSVSPKKNADSINRIGLALQEKYNLNYLVADFKKRDGYKKSIEISKLFNLYRQNYCGCLISKR